MANTSPIRYLLTLSIPSTFLALCTCRVESFDTDWWPQHVDPTAITITGPVSARPPSQRHIAPRRLRTAVSLISTGSQRVDFGSLCFESGIENTWNLETVKGKVKCQIQPFRPEVKSLEACGTLILCLVTKTNSDLFLYTIHWRVYREIREWNNSDEERLFIF